MVSADSFFIYKLKRYNDGRIVNNRVIKISLLEIRVLLYRYPNCRSVQL